MQVESKKHNVDIYHLDISGINGSWIWDFGVFTLVGTSTYPIRKIRNMTVFSAVINNIDVDSIKTKEPDKSVNLDLYIGDYIIYTPTVTSNATHFVSEDNALFKVIEDTVYYNNEPHIVLQKVNINQTKKLTYHKDEIDDWTPVMEIL